MIHHASCVYARPFEHPTVLRERNPVVAELPLRQFLHELGPPHLRRASRSLFHHYVADREELTTEEGLRPVKGTGMVLYAAIRLRANNEEDAGIPEGDRDEDRSEVFIAV